MPIHCETRPSFPSPQQIPSNKYAIQPCFFRSITASSRLIFFNSKVSIMTVANYYYMFLSESVNAQVSNSIKSYDLVFVCLKPILSNDSPCVSLSKTRQFCFVGIFLPCSIDSAIETRLTGITELQM